MVQPGRAGRCCDPGQARTRRERYGLGVAVDPRSLLSKPRDFYVPDLHINSIKVKTRDFR